ncbi:MAG: hypothetical protein KDD38_09680 [Bdellovibrionales bacterium]|nr:hypothetical protein [Bdellovibrionales bacterium]
MQKLFSSIWFASFGVLASAVLFIIPALREESWPMILFIWLPAMSSGAAGFICGDKILDPDRINSYWGASVWGVVLSVLSMVIFTPAFIFIYYLIDDDHIDLAGLLAAVYTAGGYGVVPIFLFGGAIAGASLFSVRKYIT